jgi:5-methylcytosine-specific restriction endonuclease McrA
MAHCSAKCYFDSQRGKPREWLKRRGTKTCPECKNEFEIGGRSGQKWSQVYCSEKCAGRARRAPIDNFFTRKKSGHWSELSVKIINRDKACIFCGRTKNLQCHHLIPREYGGTHDEDNLGAACRRCHMVVDAMIKIMKTKNPDFDILAWLTSFMERKPNIAIQTCTDP